MIARIIRLTRPTYGIPSGVVEVRVGSDHFVENILADQSHVSWGAGEIARESYIQHLIDQAIANLRKRIADSMEFLL